MPMCLNSLQWLENSNGDVSSGDDSAWIPATSFMPDADELSGTEDIHDIDLDASAMTVKDQERAHCVTLVSSIV